MFRILRPMRRERLKDQITNPRVSLFDSLVRALVVLISLGAVYYALSGRGYPLRPQKAPTAAAPASEAVTLLVTSNHSFYWNNQGPFPLDDFNARLATWLKTAQAPQLVITAEDSALLADALYLHKESRRQGVTNIRLEARARSAP